MESLQNSKSILAKLLAQENISIVHKSVSTAYFDLNTRTMVLPIWKDMDGDLYDLLTGHEVGHACETPLEGWHNSVTGNSRLKGFKSFLNVVEDARIEKLVKRRYPGLTRSFSRAYKSLYDRDFFGISGLDVNTLKLIDKINIRFKLGSFIPVRFSDIELQFVNEIEQAETWQQVEEIATRLYEYSKEHEANPKGDDSEDSDDSEEFRESEDSDDSGESDDFEDSDESDDSEDSEDSDDFEDSDNSEDSDESGNSGSSEDSDESVSSDDPISITDNSFRRRESELVNLSDNVVLWELPEAKLENIIVSNKVVIDKLEEQIKSQISILAASGSYAPTYEQLVTRFNRKFQNKNKKYIMHIVKEFDMRKSATSYARQLSAKTGLLDMDKLHKFKFTNDLFKKITIVPKGKNHGLVMFLDMSGSMTDIISNTMEQMLVFTSFCKKVNIPFDVYGFSDSSMSMHEYFPGRKEMPIYDLFTDTDCHLTTQSAFHMKHIISSKLSDANYRRCVNNLLILIYEWQVSNYQHRRNYRHRPLMENADNDCGIFEYGWRAKAGFSLHSTPLLATILSSREIITEFRSKYKLDIVNVIYLTDGEASDELHSSHTHTHTLYNYKTTVFLLDKKTKKRVSYVGHSKQFAAVTSLIREVTGCKHIAFYLTNALTRQFASGLNHLQFKSAKQTFKKTGFFMRSFSGYDEYYYIKPNTGCITEEQLQVDENMTNTKLATQFKKFQMGKTTSRALVARLAESLATV